MARTRAFYASSNICILNENFEKYFKEYNFHKLYKELVKFLFTRFISILF